MWWFLLFILFDFLLLLVSSSFTHIYICIFECSNIVRSPHEAVLNIPDIHSTNFQIT